MRRARLGYAVMLAFACGGAPPAADHAADMPSNHIDPPAATHDACARKADLDARGNTAMQTGDYDRALGLYTQVLDCGDVQMIRKAYMAACDANQFPRAHALYRRLPGDGTTRALRQLCLRRGFDPL